MLAAGVRLAVVVLPDGLALGVEDSALEHKAVDELEREPVTIGVRAGVGHGCDGSMDLNRDRT